MTLTIHRGNDNSYLMVSSKDERLYRYGYANYDGHRLYWVNIDASDAYSELSDLSSFVINTLGEECLFEMD